MAGSSMTFAYDDGHDGSGGRGCIRKVIAEFLTDDATGSVAGTTRKISGCLIKIVTDPGTPAPDANWDVVLTDEEGADLSIHMDDVAIAALIARHTTTTLETYLPLEDTAGTGRIAAYPAVCDRLTITVNNGGNAKAGQIILYYRPW